MKKITLITVFSFLSVCCIKAQITITQADMPQAGDTIRLSTDNVNTGLPDPTLTGPSHTWDYTKLVPYTQTIDTFLSVGSTPLAYQLYFNDIFLPAYKATVAQSAPNLPALGPITITNVIDFYKATSSAYEDVGFGSTINSIPTSVKDDTIDYMYMFPMNYGNADSCHSSFHMSVASLAYYGGRQFRVNHVDGWGTLKTPFGTFNTLRVTTQLYVTDTVYVDTFHFGFGLKQPEQIQYKWFGLGSKVPLLQVNEDVVGSNPVFVSAVYQDSARNTILGVAQINSPYNGIVVAPNPNNGVFNIAIPNYKQGIKINLDVYNIIGEKVYAAGITSTNTRVNLSGNAAGVYLYRLTDENRNLVSTGKVIVK
jgi:hypothetical protein